MSTIEELRSEKVELEEKIRNDINEFAKKHGIGIKYVDARMVDLTNFSDERYKMYLSKITIEVDI